MPSERSDTVRPHPILTEYYADEQERRRRVDGMFDASARHYDRINNIMSFGSGRWYRRQALARAGLGPGQSLLDVGAGTGVVAALAQDVVGENGYVAALDPSEGMLAVAAERGVKNTIQGLGEAIPFPDNSFDMVSMGYALRHVSDLTRLFKEYRRVLKPGGKMLLLEITRPENRLAKLALRLYLRHYIPTVTRLFLRNVEAQKLMKYYWDTIDNCVPPATILDVMDGVGLEDVRRHVVQGVFSEYTGVEPVHP
jgi:demethylmenaquinone methyltransferase/2-methoxy-6-polyprenyl-1,4-benzoquinol methylase